MTGQTSISLKGGWVQTRVHSTQLRSLDNPSEGLAMSETAALKCNAFLFLGSLFFQDLDELAVRPNGPIWLTY
jgi:hypothetical protein